jgi:L-malate glycosyltransferase
MTPLGILHLTTFLQGGAGRAIADLACAQHAAGHRVTVVASTTGKGEFANYPEYLQTLRRAGVTVHTWDSLFTRDLALNMRVVAHLRANLPVQRVDVVHAHAGVPAFIGRLFIRDAGHRHVGLVQTQHGWGANKTTAQAAFDLAVLHDVDAAIVTSQATADLLAATGARSAFEIIPCGLPSNDAGEPPADAVKVLEPLRARGARLIGCIGSVMANKNQRLLIEALARTTSNVVAVFIGEGSERLVEYARARGVGDRVVACGYRPRASRWLRLLDMLAVPSRTEGQGLVALEAFRSGIPVVASHIPALAELIEDGTNGLLFEPDNADALAAAIERVVAMTEQDRHALVTAACRRFHGEYTVERMVARHEALYRKLVGERPAAAGGRGAKGGLRRSSKARSNGGWPAPGRIREYQQP